MQIEFIDISTFKGICSEAEHFYATVGSPENLQENLLFLIGCQPNSGVSHVDTMELRYYPSQEEAEILFRKDHGWEKDSPVFSNPTLKKDIIEDYKKTGTIRFPDILSVIKTAKQMFPDAVLCFSFRGSVKEFQKILHNNEKLAEQVWKIVQPKVKNNNNNEVR